MGASKEFPIATWLGPPKSWTAGRVGSNPQFIVIHTTEGSEGPTSAEDGAAYDRRRTDGTSTHFFVDSNSIVQTVYTYDEAHAARAHGNDIGIQIEICGKAGQTATQWNDAASAPTLENVARLCVAIRAKYGAARFPAVRRTASQVRAGLNGFCGHVDITNAFPEDNGTHTDPGTNFPWAQLFRRINELEDQVALENSDKTYLETNIGPQSDVVPRWTDVGSRVAADDANPKMTVSEGIFYTGAGVRRVENTVTALASALAQVLANVQADDADKAELLASIAAAKDATVQEILDGLGTGRTDEETAALLRTALGDRADGVFRAGLGQ